MLILLQLQNNGFIRTIAQELSLTAGSYFTGVEEDGSTHLLCQFAILVDVTHLLAAEVGGGLSTGAAVHRNFRVAAVVVTVARGGLALVHGVVLGGPLQRWQALRMPAEHHTDTRMSRTMSFTQHNICF